MSVSAISGSSGLYGIYSKMSSGKKINSAADDAAGLAIAQKLAAQSTGYSVGRSNAKTSQNMTNVADGALSSVTDSLERIRELSVKASSGLYGDSERAMIQSEIDQMKQSISDISSQTQFNSMNLLDGSMKSSYVASDSNGGGMTMSMPDSTLEALGIADYDVRGDFDISVIDKALDMVNSSRTSLGAASNRLDHTMSYNSLISYNLTASRSRIEDLDYGTAVTNQKKEELLQTYRFIMQRNQQEDENGKVLRLFQMN